MPILPSFRTLITSASVTGLLKDYQKYLAHTPNEQLVNHMKLVSDYFLQIIQHHKLETALDNLLLKIGNGNSDYAMRVKQLFWDAILYHDFGKVNENFQRIKMGNVLFPLGKPNGIETQHSILSAYLFLIHQYSAKDFQSIADSDKKLYSLVAFFGHNILKHHSARLDDLSERKTFQKFTEELCADLVFYLGLFSAETNEDLVTEIPRLPELLQFDLPFDWFLLIRIHFSLLTAADYYATSHYCGKWKTTYEYFGTLKNDQKSRHYKYLKTSLDYNKYLYDHFEKILEIDPNDLKRKSTKTLNHLRSKIAAEVVHNIRKYSDEQLFYIEAPTGSGKTNLAFIATQELLNSNPELNKVYYVFPFTTLITQTIKSAQNALGLLPDEFAELHSKAALKEKEKSEAEQDGSYGQTRLDDIHNQFVNYPYVFLSHVHFFDILKSNDKSSIYLLHRLANSVVVIDEVQSYNPMLWDKIAYLLKQYANILNIRFIVMSATLPKIGNLAAAPFTHLISDATNRYFANPNFSERVKFSAGLMEGKFPDKEERKKYIRRLANKIYDKAEKYHSNFGTAKVIVEFIFKKSATEFAETAKEVFVNYEILVMSGTILEPRRREIIHYLKNPDFSKNKILLVTTQVVEAGVDIDMDLGFKNKSIIDSEEQLAGRVNRNSKKKDCAVYLFELDDASVIYGKDPRYKEWKKGLEKDYLTILQTKRFDRVYDKVTDFLNKTNEQKNTGGTLTSYKNKVASLNFPGIDHDFQLIEQENTSIFIPLNLPIYITNEAGNKESIFTKGQIRFLREKGVVIENECLSGTEVFQLYKNIIRNQPHNFVDRKRDIRSTQAIMSMFTISLLSESTLIEELKYGGNPVEYGYLYLVSHEDVYDYHLGLLDKKFNSLIFL